MEFLFGAIANFCGVFDMLLSKNNIFCITRYSCARIVNSLYLLQSLYESMLKLGVVRANFEG